MMKPITFPLFWRIFLSIWLALALTVVFSNLAMTTLQDRERQDIERQIGLRDVGLEALQVRATRGRGEAWRFLKDQGERLGLRLVLVSGDESTGKLPPPIRDHMQSGWFRERPAVVELGGGYRLVAWPRQQGGGWLDPKHVRFFELVLGFVLMTLACWWIARMVSRPLKHMEGTARSIAAGDTGLRVSESIASRRDEVGQLATAFNAMTDQLCNLLERQRHLLRDISHDLRTPLARQRVAIELASEGGVEEQLMASILRQNERLETMTSQILNLYRVAAQGENIEYEAVRPLNLVNRVLRDAADYAEQRGVDCQLSSDTDAGNLSVLADPGLLQRALDNILQNALDHTPPGNRVRIRLDRSGDDVVIAIEDEGPGVDEALLPQLFEPFFQADKSRGGQGWGLGLAIARDIIQAHGGTVGAANSDEGGLRVTVRLPLFIGS